MQKIRFIYKIILIIMVVAAGAAYGYYQKQVQIYESEKAALQKIADDHVKKVDSMK